MWRGSIFFFLFLFTINVCQAMDLDNEEHPFETLGGFFKNNKLNLDPYSEEEGYKTYLSLKHDSQFRHSLIASSSIPFLALESLFNEFNDDMRAYADLEEPISIYKEWSYLYENGCSTYLIPVLPQVFLDDIYKAGCALFNKEIKEPPFYPKLAKKWFYRAGIYNHPHACRSFNLIWLMEAAINNIPSANYYLYKIYENNNFYEDGTNGEYYRKRALTLKYPEVLTDEAINQISLKNYKAYYELLCEASQRGSARAKSLLSDIYYYASTLRKHDPEKFSPWQRTPNWAWDHDFYFDYENDPIQQSKKIFIRRFHEEKKEDITDIFVPDLSGISENQIAFNLLIESAKQGYPPAQAKLAKYHSVNTFSKELTTFENVKIIWDYKGTFIEFLLFYFPEKKNSILSLRNYIESKEPDFWDCWENRIWWVYERSTRAAPLAYHAMKSAFESASKIERHKYDEWDSRGLRHQLFEQKVVPSLPRISDIPPLIIHKEEREEQNNTLSIELDKNTNIIDFFTKPPSPRRKEARIEQGLQLGKKWILDPTTQYIESEINKMMQSKKNFEVCGGFTHKCLAQANLLRVAVAYGLEGGYALERVIRKFNKTVSMISEIHQRAQQDGLIPKPIIDPISIGSTILEGINTVVESVPTVARRGYRLFIDDINGAQNFGDIVEAGTFIFGPGKVTKIGGITSKVNQFITAHATKGKNLSSALDLAKASKIPIVEPTKLKIEVSFKKGMDPKAYERKMKILEKASQEDKLFSNIPHHVSQAERREQTRKYRKKVVKKINSFYKNNPKAKENALTKLSHSDIDHKIDLQLGGQNMQKNLKSLDSITNQGIGSQISGQIPKDKKVNVTIEKKKDK